MDIGRKPHAKSRGVRFGHQPSYNALAGRVINERTCYDALDDIVDNTVLSNYKKKVIQNTNTIVEVSSDTRTVSVDVKPAVNKQPDRLIVSPMDVVKPIVSDQPDRLIGLSIVNTDGQDDCLMRMGQTPRNRDNASDDVTKQVGELLPVSRVVVPTKTAEEVFIVECPAGQVVKNETTKPTVSTEISEFTPEADHRRIFGSG